MALIDLSPKSLARGWLVVAGALLVGACATVDPQTGFADVDKLEGVSRKIHQFNVAMDRNLLHPAAQGYDAVTPTLTKHLISNGFSHLQLPRDFANHLLQGEVDPALETLGRFTINTVLGAGGLLDPATEFGLPKQDNDFGITLGKHGVGAGYYLVLPFFGPTTTRDSVGRIVDLAFAPTSYIGVIEPGLNPELPAGLFALESVNFRHQNSAVIDDLLYNSEDSYVSLRAVYLQRRRAQIAGDDSGADALPDIFNKN